MFRNLAASACVAGFVIGCESMSTAGGKLKADGEGGATAGLCASVDASAAEGGYLSKPNTTLDQDVEYLIRMTGAAVAGEAIADALLEQLPPRFPDAPRSFWMELGKRFRPDDFVAIVVPIYAKHFTQEEVRQMIAFNETPVGKKVINTMPEVELETMRAADEWGTKIGAGVVAELRAAGYAPAPPPAMPIPGAPTVP